MKSILVTGGLGFIGSNLVKLLTVRYPDARITIVDKGQRSFDIAKRHSFGNPIEVFVGDVLFPDSRWVHHYDAVFHLAGITDTTVRDHSHNVLGFHSLLYALMPWKPPIVFASSASVYGVMNYLADQRPFNELQDPRPGGSYSISKYQMELLAEEYRTRYAPWPIIGLRYFNVYGEGEEYKGKSSSMIYQLWKQMKAQKRPILFRPGNQVRDFVHVSDVCEMTLLAMISAVDGPRRVTAKVLNCGSAVPFSFNAIVEKINNSLNTSWMPEYIENRYPEFFQPYTCADMGLAWGILRFQPHVIPSLGITAYIRQLEK